MYERFVKNVAPVFGLAPAKEEGGCTLDGEVFHAARCEISIVLRNIPYKIRHYKVVDKILQGIKCTCGAE